MRKTIVEVGDAAVSEFDAQIIIQACMPRARIFGSGRLCLSGFLLCYPTRAKALTSSSATILCRAFNADTELRERDSVYDIPAVTRHAGPCSRRLFCCASSAIPLPRREDVPLAGWHGRAGKPLRGCEDLTHSRNVDLKELRNRLELAVALERVSKEHCNWKRGSKRLNGTIDHINAAW